MTEKAAPKPQQCSTCKFFRPDTKHKPPPGAVMNTKDVSVRHNHHGGDGYCHRNAPQTLERNRVASWPAVRIDHWCGEYKR